uniref:Uncharacterized protein n=1 Tax=Anguilla anguilla TaxID=7936 RepID=A0A0E9WHW0_ANGAN
MEAHLLPEKHKAGEEVGRGWGKGSKCQGFITDTLTFV